MVSLERLYGGESLTVRRVAGLIVGFARIVVLVWPERRLEQGQGRTFAWGIAATQVACLGWAIGSSLSKRRRLDENVSGAASLQGGSLRASHCSYPATLRDEWREVSFNARTTAALAYLIVFGSVVGYSAYAYALKHLSVSTVARYAYVNPVIAVVLGSFCSRNLSAPESSSPPPSSLWAARWSESPRPPSCR